MQFSYGLRHREIYFHLDRIRIDIRMFSNHEPRELRTQDNSRRRIIALIRSIRSKTKFVRNEEVFNTYFIGIIRFLDDLFQTLSAQADKDARTTNRMRSSIFCHGGKFF